MQFNMIFFLIVQLSIKPNMVLANYVLQIRFNIWKKNGKVFHYVTLVIPLKILTVQQPISTKDLLTETLIR